MKDQCDTLPYWRIRHIIKDMKEYYKNIRGKFYHIPRNMNSTTYQLARNASTMWLESPIFIFPT